MFNNLVSWWNRGLQTVTERQALSFLQQSVHSFCQAVKQRLRQSTKPDNQALILILNAALDLTRSKSELVLESALLRQQLIVLKRQAKRPALTW